MVAPAETGRATRFEITRSFGASMAAMEAVCLEFREILGSRYDRNDVFVSELLLREALANAVVHGCGLDERKQVSLTARLRADRITISVLDEGPGFGWRTAAEYEPGDGEVCHRGMCIYRRYADRVRFNRNGNRVTLVRRLDAKDPAIGERF